jgi:glycosyltransferase involved in cell wall biosynthesis
MRIGLITGEYPLMQGGVADFTRALGMALVELGHTVHVLTDRQGTGDPADGLHVTPAVANWNRASLRGVGQWAQEHRLDVVNLQYQTAAYNMAPLIHLLPRLIQQVPFVTTFHDLRVPYLFPKAGPLRDWWVLRLARDADAAITTNIEDTQGLERAGGVPRIACIPIGSNITGALPPNYDRAAWRARLGVQPGETLIAYFGFLNRSKGVDVLLKALAEAHTVGCGEPTPAQDNQPLNRSVSGRFTKKAHTPGSPLRLVIIGGRTGASDPTNAAYADEIDALAASLGLADRLHWTGFVEAAAVSAYLTAADCCALPFMDGVSFRRGSLMAALAHGCPIITTAPTVPDPLLVDRTHGWLVPPGDVPALADALRILAADADLRDRLATGARDLYRHFTWESIAAHTADLFADLISCSQ